MAWRSRHLARLALSTALSAAWVAPAMGGVVVPTQADIKSTTLPAGALPVAVVTDPTSTNSVITVPVGRSIINWNSFNIQGQTAGSPATTTFTTLNNSQPSAVLNRVVGGGSTTIDGVLTAPSTMQLFILNSAGVLFGGNARVTAGSLIASTRNMLDQSFLDGKFSFLDQQTDLKDPTTGAGSPGGAGEISVSGAASLVANGALRDATGAATAAGTGGLYLIGARVAVNGAPAAGQKTVDATGDVAFVAADEVTITPNVGSPLSITITQGTSVPDAIRVSGSIRGESVTLALASRDSLVNTLTASGSLEATNAAGGDGGVVLLADAPTTAVTVPGTGGASTLVNSAAVTSQSGYRVAAAGGITLGAASGTAPVSQSAADDISIVSVDGAVVASGLTAGSATPGIGALQAGGTLSVKGTSVTLTGAQGSTIDISATGELASVNRLAATGTGLDPTTVVAKVSATAGETVVGTASTVSGGVSLDAKGLILLAQATTSGTVALFTTGAAEVGTVHGDSGVSVTAGSISASTFQSAKGTVSVTGTGTGGNSTIVIGTLESQATTFDAGAAAVTLSGQDTVSITQAKTASGTLTLKTPGSLEVTTVTGGGAVTLNGGSVVATTLSAGGAVDIRATKSLVGGADGSVNVGSVTTTPVDAVNSTSNLTINADTKATVSGPVNVGGDYRVTGTGVALGTAGVDTPIVQKAGGVVTVTATAGDIAAAGPLSLLSDKGGSDGHALTLNAQNGSITGAPNLSGGGGTSAVAVIAPAATTVSLGTVTGSDLIDANGAVGLATPGMLTVGDITIGGKVLLDTTSATVPGGASINTGAVNAGGGGIAVKASGIATIAGAVSTVGAYAVTGSTVVLGQVLPAGASPTLQQAGGPITLQSTTGTVGTAGLVTLQGTAGTSQVLLVYGAGGVDLSGAAINTASGAGPLAVNVGAGANQSITLGTITADTLGGAVLANGILTSQPILGGSGTLTFDGPVQVNGPLTAVTSNNANIVASQAVTSASDLSFTAAGSFSGAASTLTGRTVSAQALGGDVNVGTIVAKAVGGNPTTISGSLTAQNNVTVGTATVASGQLFLKAGTTLSVGTATAGGAITLSAGGNALVDMATAGKGGVGDLTLTQAQAVSSRSGGRAMLAAAGALSLTATNALLLGDVSGGTGVTLKAGSVDATSLTSAGGPITGVLGGSVQVGTVTTDAIALDPTRVAVSLQGNDVSVGLANIQSGALLLNAGGTLSLGTANVGGAITLSAGNNALVDAAHAGLGGAGDLTLTQAQGVTSRSGGRAVFTAVGTLSLNATNALLLGDVSGGAGVVLKAGSLDATSLTSASGPITGVFGGSVQVGTIITNAAALDPTRVAVSLQGNDVSVGLANVQSGALLLKAGGTLSLGTANVGGAITLSAGNDALIDAAHAGLNGVGDLTLTQAQSVTNRAGGRALFTAAGTLSLAATNALLLSDISGDAAVVLKAGSLDATSITSAAGSVDGQVGGSVLVGSVTSGKGVNLITTAGSGGAITLGTLTAGGSALVQADGAALVSGTVAVTGGDYRVTGRTVELGSMAAGGTGPAQTATGAVSITAVNAITGHAGLQLVSDSDANGAEPLTLSTQAITGGTINLAGTTLLGGRNEGSDVRIAAGSAGDQLILGDVRASGLLGAITADPVATFTPGLSRTGPITTGTLSITGPVILASGDRLTTQALTGTGLSLTSGNGASVGPLLATGGDLSLLSNGGLFQLTAGATAQAGSVLVKGTGGFQADGALSATGGDIRLSGTGGFASTAGLISVAANGDGGTISNERSGDFTATTLSATGDLLIGQAVQPASVAVSGATTVGGALAAQIAGDARFSTVGVGNTISLNAGSLSAAAVTAGETLVLVTTRDLSATSVSGTAVTLSGSTLSVTDSIEARTGDATLSTPGTLTTSLVKVAGTLKASVGNATIGTVNAGTVSLAASAGSLDLGIVSAGGDEALSATNDIRIDQATAGGFLSIKAGGDVTGQAFASGGALQVSANNITLQNGQAGGITAITTVGVATVANLESSGDLSLAAATVRAGTLASNSGALAVTATGGDLGLDKGTGGGAVTLSATGQATIGTLSTGGPLSIRAAGLGLNSATAGGSATIAIDNDASFSSLTAGGNINTTIGGSLQAETMLAAGGLTTIGNTLALGTVRATTGPLTLQANGGALQLTDGQSGGVVSLLATGPLLVEQLTTPASASLTGETVTLDTATVGALDLKATRGDVTLGSINVTGDAAFSATGGIAAQQPLRAGGNITVQAGGSFVGGGLTSGKAQSIAAGTLSLDTSQAGTALILVSNMGPLTVGTATAGGPASLSAAGDVQIGTITAGGDLSVSAGGRALLGSVGARQGALTIKAGEGLTADTLSAAGGVTLAAGADTAVATIAAGDTLTATTGGAFSLRTISANGNATLSAVGAFAVSGSLSVGGALTASASFLTLGNDGGATILQQAGGPISLTAINGLITGRAGLSLQSNTGDLLLTAIGGAGGIAFDSASGMKAATGSVIASTTGLGAFGTVEAGGRSVSLTAADLALAGNVAAPAIQLSNGSPGNVTLLGDAPAGVSEFSAGSAPAFALSGSELGRLHADTVVVNAGTGAVRLGDMPLSTEAARSSFQVATSGRIDVLGDLSAAGSSANRTVTLGGDEAAGRATMLRVAATAAGGGRLNVGAATLDLRADNIAVGLDANFNAALGAVPGGTPLSASAAASRYVAMSSSSLYNSMVGTGGSGYTNPTLLTAGRLVVRYSGFALFQNTGLAGIDTGLMLGGSGSTGPALSLQPASTGGNAFAFFGSINGIGGTATSLLGNDVLAVGSGVSRADSRANGCLIGAAGSGCLASNLVQPNINLFDVSRADVFRSAEDLTLPFEPLVSTNNEALFSDIASIDQAAAEVPCAPGTTYCPTPGTQAGTRPETRP